MKSCPACNTTTEDDAVICLECLHDFKTGEQPKRYLVNKERLTAENVGNLCLALMFEHDERYVHFADLWRELEAEMIRGGRVIDFGDDMGTTVFSVVEAPMHRQS